MLIYEKINELKELNESLKNELVQIKSSTKGELEKDLRANLAEELAKALQEAKSQVNAYADERVRQASADLEAYHAREVKRLFEAKIADILEGFSIDELSQKIAYQFAKENAKNASNALESIILSHTSEFIRKAKNDIENATTQALSASAEILQSARELKNELTSEAGLNQIRKYRFEASLHLGAIVAQSQLKTLALAFSANEFPPKIQESISNAFATK